MRRSMGTLWCALAIAGAASSLHAQATGNPAADGWTAGGNSMANGTYIRGGGIFSYTTYGTNFVVAPGSNLISSAGTFSWNAGDRILALGGVFVTAPTAEDNGWGPGSSYSTSQSTGGGGSSSINGNITTSMRMIGKFGNSPVAYTGPGMGSWTASTIAPGGGDGLGSDSAGHGGIGSVVIGNSVGDIGSVTSGTPRLPTVAQIYNGAGTTPVDVRVGRMVYVHASSIVSSWEMLINLDVLAANYGGTFSDLPQVGDRGNVAVQRSTNAVVFHDALVTVPAPGAAGAIALGGVLAMRRRR